MRWLVLDKSPAALGVCLVAIASLRIAATYPEQSLTVDEAGHFACGLELTAPAAYREPDALRNPAVLLAGVPGGLHMGHAGG